VLHRVCERVGAELPEEVADVCLERVGRDPQMLREPRAIEALERTSEDVGLSRGEVVQER
jgi:hypothetical protein